jgi:AcrR family transcriptional regulator
VTPKSRSRQTAGVGRRQQLIDSAVELIQDRGFLGTSIQDVADQLDLTKAAFYYFVKNKEQLLYEILQQALNLAVASMTKIAEGSLPPSEKLRMMVDGYLHLLAERGDLFNILFQEKRHLAPAHLAAVDQTEQELVRLWKAVYLEGVEAGELRQIDPTVAAFAAIGMCSWTIKWFNPEGRLSPAEVSAMLQSTLLDGFRLRS